MTIKQMLLSALIFSTVTNFGLAIESTSNKSTSFKKTPSLLTMYTFRQKECYGTQEVDVSIEFEGMNQDIFNKLKEINKEDDFIVCPCNIPGFPKQIAVYNPTSPFKVEDETDRCTHLQLFLSTLSETDRKAAVAYFSAAK